VGYCVQSGEPIVRGLKRVAREEVDAAIRQLTGTGDCHEAIHEARKSIKKLRALLRLIEPKLGNVARTESHRLRDLARSLSAVRDAAAMVETFDQMAEAHPAEMGLNRFAGIRRQLIETRDQAVCGFDEKSAMAAGVAELRKLRRRINLWRLHGEGVALFAEGFENAYADGRKALRRAEKHASSGNIHELRKRVKDHWYHVRLVGPLWSASSEAYEHAMKELQETLGDANNVTVFLQTVDRAELGPLRDLAVRWRDTLRARALEDAARVYVSKYSPAAA
jgi:CHAD domain-containing protein